MEDDFSTLEESPQSSSNRDVLIDSLAIIGNSVQPAACALCSSILSSDNPVTGNSGLCGDCKFLCLESPENPMRESSQRRISRRRRRRSSSRRTGRHSSSESTGVLFSQQFSHIVSVMRQNHASTTEHEEQYADGETSVRSWQQNSSQSTPSRSRTGHHPLSDTESDGFENVDSLYGESESNFSFSRYHSYHGDSDAVSTSTYGGDSDTSVDEQSFFGTDILAVLNGESDLDIDTDIDPMGAGVSQWDLDNREEGEGEADVDGVGEWEDTDAEENAIEEHVGHPENNPSSSGQIDRDELIILPEMDGLIHMRFRGRDRENSRTIASDLVLHEGNSGDYLGARAFQELLEHFAENESVRRGAPPASVSYIKSLPLVTISEEQVKQDTLSCAICKDALTVGSEANQLPCSHFYHPSCILPWLSSRNSCPLCRYELPTDDVDYKENKQRNIRRMRDAAERRMQRVVESSQNEAEVTEEHELLPMDPSNRNIREEGGQGRWLYRAATPILGLVGVALVLWLGQGRSAVTDRLNILEAGQARLSVRENLGRRWWPF